jgi:glycosyltransferase involved in cell wall biosynthesis
LNDGKRYRIAMVAACAFPANHGTPGAIRELSIALAQLGHEVHLVTYPNGDDVPLPGVTVHRVSSGLIRPSEIKVGPSYERLYFDFLMMPKLVQVVREHRIDVIHAHNYEATIIGAIAKYLTRTPLVYNGINSMADELPSYSFFPSQKLARRLGKALDHTVPRASDALILLSEELRDYLEKLGISGAKTIVLPPGVTLSDFERGDGARARQKHGIAPNTPIVIYTGALESFQGLDYLVRAMAITSREHPDAKLLIVNNIPNQEVQRGLEQLATELGILDRLIFVPSVPFRDLPDYLAAGDVAVVPRPSCPGFPIKLLNYMAAGLATVTFEAGGKSLAHGYNGYTAPNGDVAGFAAGINLFLSKPELRKIVGARAKESIVGLYDWDTIARATAMIYGQVMTRRRMLNRLELATYVKAGYTPFYVGGGRDNPSGFLQSGPIDYPSFM